MKQFVIRAIFFLVGLFILTLGISLTIKADLGAGAWDALNVGLHDTIGFTVGTWVIIIGSILIVTNALLARERPDILAFFTITFLGIMIDFWMEIVMVGWDVSTFVTQIPLMVLGIVFIAIGVSIYIQPKFPLNPIDNFMVAVQKRFKLNLMKSKTITEALAVVLAFFLGGPIGIGTFIILFLIGPSIQFFDPKAKRVLNTLLEEKT